VLAICVGLAKIASLAEEDKEKALRYCSKAWVMAEKAGFEKFSVKLLFELTNVGLEQSIN
jgi:hypothetical protein